MNNTRTINLCFKVILFAVVFLTFCRSLNSDFVNWDDVGFILQNPHLNFTWPNIKWMFTTCYHGPYQPLAWISLSLDKGFWQLDPFGFHLTAALLHATAALLVFIYISSLSRIVAPSTTDRERNIATFIASILFAIHPLRVESVSWISERRDLLMGIFSLFTVIIYQKQAVLFRNTKIPTAKMILVLVALELAILSKANAVMLPVIFLILDLFVYRRFSEIPLQFRLWKLIHEKFTLWIIAFLGGVIAIFGQNESGSGMVQFSDYGVMPRLAQSALSLTHSLKQLFFPQSLIPLVELREIPSFTHLPELASLIIIVLVSGVLGWKRKQHSNLLGAWLIFIVLSLPTSGLIQTGQQLYADRYTYLPSMIWAGTLGLIPLFQNKTNTAFRPILFCLSLLFGFSLGWMTLNQQDIWKNSKTLWQQTLNVDPSNYPAHVMLGNVLQTKGEIKKASKLFQEATRLRPEAPEAWFGLGTIEFSQQNYAHAQIAFRKVLDVNPNYPNANDWLQKAKESSKR